MGRNIGSIQDSRTYEKPQRGATSVVFGGSNGVKAPAGLNVRIRGQIIWPRFYPITKPHTAYPHVTPRWGFGLVWPS